MAAFIAVIRRQKQELPLQSVQSLINKESKEDVISHKIRDTTFDKKIEEIYQEAKKPWWKRW
ncbi:MULTISPECIES: hypothetical protein [unclassified Bacillus (in: firmicutes)]|uniref:hypothetical protein n=1 Tax=unclassified Bacillus (in: firmicutes) TaxID=185979 RepID=UPI0021C03924|nr:MULTISPECIES: hypothetical protein [unclassified Bacillus (in: firmicutes)]